MKSNKAFTLIELLVVISIVTMLIAVTLPSLGISRAKSRDAKRKLDLKQLSTAIELYYDEHSIYPPGAQAADYSYCAIAVNETPNGYSLPELLTPKYILTIPTDPRYPTSLDYKKCFLYLANQAIAGSTYYRLYATLESPTQADLSTMNPSDPGDSWFLGMGVNYKYIAR